MKSKVASKQESKWIQDALRGHSASKIARKSKVSPQKVARAFARLGLVNQGSVAHPEWVMKTAAKAAKKAKAPKSSKTKKAPKIAKPAAEGIKTIKKTVKKASAKRAPYSTKAPTTTNGQANGHSSDRVIVYRVNGTDALERCPKVELSKRLIDLTLAGQSPQVYAPVTHRLAVEFG